MNAEALRFPTRAGAERRLVLAVVLVLVCLTPAIVRQQLVTGTAVNMALLVCAAAVGGPEAAVFGVVPSVVAVTSGTLPAALLPVVPFIMVSNALLVGVFASLYRRAPLGALLAAAFLKFGFLSLTSLFVPFFLPAAAPVAAMLAWPQLATALAGGFLALGILHRGGPK